MRTAAALLVLALAIALAGCSGQPRDPAAADLPDGTGGVQVWVRESAGAQAAIADAIVYIPGTGLTANTDAEGHVVFRGVVPGDYTAQAYREGYEGPPMQFEVPEGAYVQVVFLLDRLSR